MSLFEVPTTASTKQIRQFGCICLIVLPTLTWYWTANVTHLVLSTICAAVIMGLAWTYPRLLVPLFLGLMCLAAPIGLIVGEIAMSTLYVLVFCPIGLVFKLRNRDALQMKMKAPSQSHWLDKSSPSSSESYYHLY